MPEIEWHAAIPVGYIAVPGGSCATPSAVSDTTRRIATLLDRSMNDPNTRGGYDPDRRLFTTQANSQGRYQSRCGYESTALDYCIGRTDRGLLCVTNSLLVHYAHCHGSLFQPEEWNIVDHLADDAEPMLDDERLKKLLYPPSAFANNPLAKFL